MAHERNEILPQLDDFSRVEPYLRDMDYPAPRNKILAVAIANGAPAEVIDTIRRLPETADFMRREDLERAFRG